MKACVSIGVNKVTGSALAVLQDAAAGAERLHLWAEKNGFHSTLLTDLKEPLKLEAIKKAVKAHIDGGATQLLVYFGGHGLLKAPDVEVWLLSGAMSDSQEAVNMAGSVALARNGRIPNVIFISDACRSVTTNQVLFRVNGGEIFPPDFVPRDSAELDRLYATLPGSPAAEFQDPKDATKYRGLFTECLMKALEGQELSAIETLQENGVPFKAVSTRSLKPYLKRAVPQAAAAIQVTLVQKPDSIVESQAPQHIVKVAPTQPVTTATIPQPQAPALRDPSRVVSDTARGFGLESFFAPEDEMFSFDVEETGDAAFAEDVEHLMGARGRRSFETRTGFTVVGERILNAHASGLDVDVFQENSSDGANQVRVYPQGDSRTVLVEFAGGTGACLAVLPGFIGTVTVEGGLVTNVSYTPATSTKRFQELFQYEEEEVERRRAFAAAAARRGYFRVEAGRVTSFSSYVRDLKSLDPTLGLYAIYSYFQANMRKDAASVLEYMQQDALPQFDDDEVRPILFDAMLLAGQITEEALLAKPPHVAPFCPVLTQGWAYLFGHVPVNEVIRKAGEHVLPGLWTTFSPAGVSLLKDWIGSGRIR